MSAVETDATLAIVFFSGTDDWSMEWFVLWEMVKARKDPSQWPWDRICSIQREASSSIGIPFELIVAKGNPVEYGPFPWKPQDL